MPMSYGRSKILRLAGIENSKGLVKCPEIVLRTACRFARKFQLDVSSQYKKSTSRKDSQSGISNNTPSSSETHERRAKGE